MAIINVEVAYARPDCQRIIALTVEAGSTVEQVILQSGVLDAFPEIDLMNQKVGIFSRPAALSDAVQKDDRVEIYRSLAIDPKEARRQRAESVRERK